MRVRFVGSGDAFGSGGRWQTCIQLAAEGQVLLVDCGATSLAAMKSQGLDPNAVGAVAAGPVTPAWSSVKRQDTVDRWTRNCSLRPGEHKSG
jgi:hypothetical protein